MSSLASRVVLARDLDTRELPLHLHMEMEQYRRMRGDFTLLSVDFQVGRIDEEAMTEEERKYACRWLDKSGAQNVAWDSQLVMKRLGKDRWTAVRPVDGQGSPDHFEEDPTAIMDQIQACRRNFKNMAGVTSYEYSYLENGKVFSVQKVVKIQPKVDMTVLSLSLDSWEIDAMKRLVWVRKLQNTVKGLACTITYTSTRKETRTREHLTERQEICNGSVIDKTG